MRRSMRQHRLRASERARLAVAASHILRDLLLCLLPQAASCWDWPYGEAKQFRCRKRIPACFGAKRFATTRQFVEWVVISSPRQLASGRNRATAPRSQQTRAAAKFVQGGAVLAALIPP